MIAEMGRE
jgi:hypothetical protein